MKMQAVNRREVALTEEEKEILKSAEVILKQIVSECYDEEMNAFVDDIAYHDGSSQPVIEDFTAENAVDCAEFLSEIGDLLFIIADVAALQDDDK